MDTSTPRALASAAAATPRPELMWTMCSFARASSASSAALWIASTSLTLGGTPENSQARCSRARHRAERALVIS